MNKLDSSSVFYQNLLLNAMLGDPIELRNCACVGKQDCRDILRVLLSEKPHSAAYRWFDVDSVVHDKLAPAALRPRDHPHERAQYLAG